MYCGQCGKKVMENMLFCPFCGSPIVIPVQDEAAQAAVPTPVSPAPPEAVKESMAESVPVEKFVSLFDDEPFKPVPEEPAGAEAQEEFKPLWFDFDEEMKRQQAAQEKKAEAKVQEAADIPEPVSTLEKAEKPAAAARPARPKPVRTAPPAGKRANTYIPLKDLAPDELFMDEKSHDEDDYDAVQERRSYKEKIYEFEERDDGTFWQRHMRGLVGLSLFLVLVLVTGIWACTSGGQRTLARFNVAWRAEAYAELGYAAYQQNSDRLAARYYERALSRDPDNYEYAHSAMVAYYEADDLTSATAMLKKCVEMDPDNPEPYQELLILYPDAASRPWEVTELVRSGYRITGHPDLKID